jgi:hypothetical protein
MKKGTYLELTLRDPAASQVASIQAAGEQRLSGTQNGLAIHVLQSTKDPADPTVHHVVVYVEGDQPAAQDFQVAATNAVQAQWSSAAAVPPQPAGPGIAALTALAAGLQLASVGDWEDYDSFEAVSIGAGPTMALTAQNQSPAVAALALQSSCIAQVTGGNAVAGTPLPADNPGRPAGNAGVFDACPADGDGSDTGTNALKNRTDDDPGPQGWITTTVGSMLALPVPAGLPTNRGEWDDDQKGAIAQFEGLPVQVVGFLAGSRLEGPEACNCHSVDDRDFHVWVVDQAGTDRSQALVTEVTPRVRANHPSWVIDQLCTLVQSSPPQQVRISGWLMMDPAHPNEIGHTRGTTWEIHPIIAIEIGDGQGGFAPL